MPDSFLINPDLAYLTDIPGIGGVIKQRPEDFLVDEQPLYEPTGKGEHLYLLIEKRSLTTSDVVRHLQRTTRVGRNDISYAGLKDKHAVTRQHFSIHLPGGKPEDDQTLLEHIKAHANFKVIWALRHENKLRRGHHGGNRFLIFIRGGQAHDVLRARKILDQMTRRGAPNYVGAQRFGYRGDNAVLGRMLLLEQWQPFLDLFLGDPRDSEAEATRAGRAAYVAGDYAQALEHWPRNLRDERTALDLLRQRKTPQQAVLALDRQQRSFLMSALQSAIFNRVLDARLRQGTFDQLVPGDLAWKHDSRAVFTVDETIAQTENALGGRVPTLAVSPTGPMFGPSMMDPAGAVLELEQRLLAAAGLTPESFKTTQHIEVPGVRRSLRVFLRDPDIGAGADEHGPYIRIGFTLDRGCFATVVLREIMKNDHGVSPEQAIEEVD